MNILIPIILQLAGIGIIVAEIIIPSGGILSILAIGIFTYSLYLVFANISVVAGAVFLIIDLIMIPVLIILSIKFLARSSFVTLRQTLSREDGVTSQSEEMEQYTGVEGIALTDLRPAGMAMLNGRRTDVVTRGEYLDKGTPVVVFKITGNQIVVKRLTEKNPSTQP